MNMNISASFQPVGSVALHGKLPRLIPPFLAVWCGQTEAKAAFADDKLLVALVWQSATPSGGLKS